MSYNYTLPDASKVGFTVHKESGDNKVAITNTLTETQSRRVFVHSLARSAGESRSDFTINLSTPVRHVSGVDLLGVYMGRTQPALHSGNNTFALKEHETVSTAVTLGGTSRVDLQAAMATVTTAKINVSAISISSSTDFEISASVDLAKAITLKKTSPREYTYAVTTFNPTNLDITVTTTKTTTTSLTLTGLTTTDIQNALATAPVGTYTVTPSSITETTANIDFEIDAPFGLRRVLNLQKTDTTSYAISIDTNLEPVAMLHIDSLGTFEGAGSITNGQVDQLTGAQSAFAAVALPLTASAESCNIMGGSVKLRTPLDRVSKFRVRILNVDGTPYLAQQEWSASLEFFGLP